MDKPDYLSDEEWPPTRAAGPNERPPPPASAEDYGVVETPGPCSEPPRVISPAELVGRRIPPRQWIVNDWLPCTVVTHHPHVHVIAPGGGLSPDGARWIACKPGFFLSVRVLSRLFRRLFLEGLAALHAAERLAFLGDLAPLADKRAFGVALAPLRPSEWVVYAKPPFAGPQAVLAYLSR